MKHTLRGWWLFALIKFLLGLWLKRRPNVMDNILRIADRVLAWKRGARC